MRRWCGWWGICLNNGFLQAVSIRPCAGREWLLIIGAVAAVCAFAIMTADITPGLRLAVACLLMLRLAWELRRRLHPAAAGRVLQLDWLPGGRWRLETAAGPALAELVHAWGRDGGPLIVMAWRREDGLRCEAWLWRHRCPPIAWRRLRTHLRLA